MYVGLRSRRWTELGTEDLREEPESTLGQQNESWPTVARMMGEEGPAWQDGFGSPWEGGGWGSQGFLERPRKEVWLESEAKGSRQDELLP